MDGDFRGDDDPVQHPWRTVEGGGRAAATLPGEQAVGRDDNGSAGRVPGLFGVGNHLGLSQRDLPREHLHALNADRAVAGLRGNQVADRIRLFGGVVLVQREGAGRGGQGAVGSSALGIGQAGGGEAVAADRHRHPFHGAGLPGRKGLDA